MSNPLITQKLRGELLFSFSKSSGPGGQNVNKVNTKVTLAWNIIKSKSITESVRSRLLYQQANRIREGGTLMITSQRYRSQQRNLEDCLHKLEVLLEAATVVPKNRKRSLPSAKSMAERIRRKRLQARKKQTRRRPRDDD